MDWIDYIIKIRPIGITADPNGHAFDNSLIARCFGQAHHDYIQKQKATNQILNQFSQREATPLSARHMPLSYRQFWHRTGTKLVCSHSSQLTHSDAGPRIINDGDTIWQFVEGVQDFSDEKEAGMTDYLHSKFLDLGFLLRDVDFQPVVMKAYFEKNLKDCYDAEDLFSASNGYGRISKAKPILDPTIPF
jgi:hypothetical protein